MNRSAPPPPAAARDVSLDALRGLAIAAMVFGHLAIAIIEPPGAFYLEAVGGVAPALFLTISGMMVAHSAWRRGRGAGHFLRRGAIVVAVGAVIDVAVWRIRPFTAVDVLYLIGISIPAAWLVAARVPPAGRLLVAALFLLGAPPLQDVLGYTDYPTEITLDGRRITEVEGLPGEMLRLERPTGILRHWIVDGWFPIFPWLGYSFLGVGLAGWRWGGSGAGRSRGGEDRARRAGVLDALAPAAVLLSAALALGWLDVEWILTPRRRYGGAFMPPRWDYLLGSVGEVLALLWIVDRRPGLRLWRPFAILGTGAFFVYAFHTPLIRVAARALGERVSHPVFLATFAAVLGVLVLAVGAWNAGAARLGRRRGPPPVRNRRGPPSG